jgi:hypothetical protein
MSSVKHIIRPDPMAQLEIKLLLSEGDGRIKVLPSAVLAKIPIDLLQWYCVTHGVYGIPSVELIEHLRELLPPEDSIEIGAGNGVFGRALGLRMTDSFQQLSVEGRAADMLRHAQQVPVQYGSDVEKLDALAAIRTYKPKHVFGSWVTHKYRPERHELGGNEEGIDDLAVCRKIETYVVYGNDKVHFAKTKLLEEARQAKKIKFDFKKIYSPETYFSRGFTPAANCLMVWRMR